jgi:L-ascorbate metabolism protein UlaG (beta-lactamase superfamily)
MSTDNNEVYLRQDVVAEPLFNRWYAWPLLISPMTAAMYVANSHVKIMQSFVSAPQVHVSALKNPAMRGGPFISYDAGKVNQVRALMQKTLKDQAEIIKFAEAIHDLESILVEDATGYSLEPLYRKVTDVLRGYVELVYDLKNRPSIRFIEPLLYKSPYYDTSLQGLALSVFNRDDRPFMFSTPRLEEDDWLYLSLPFNHEALDELFDMREFPRSIGSIKEALGIDKNHDEAFRALFTEAGEEKAYEDAGGAPRIRYFGHACILIETKDVSILVDPVISYNHGNGVKRYTYSDLPDSIDFLLITHNHQDHCMIETLLQLRRKVKTVIVPHNSGGWLQDPSLKLILRALGFRNVVEIDELDAIELEGGSITGLPFLGEHGDLSIRTKIAYLVELRNKKILIAADSNNIEPRLYENLRDFVGRIDVIFLGMECEGAPMSWLYGPLLARPLARKMDQTRRFDGSNCEKAMDMINRLSPSSVYVYAMGMEPWLTYVMALQYTEESRPIVESNQLINECRARGIIAERLFTQKEILLA